MENGKPQDTGEASVEEDIEWTSLKIWISLGLMVLAVFPIIRALFPMMVERPSLRNFFQQIITIVLVGYIIVGLRLRRGFEYWAGSFAVLIFISTLYFIL